MFICGQQPLTRKKMQITWFRGWGTPGWRQVGAPGWGPLMWQFRPNSFELQTTGSVFLGFSDVFKHFIMLSKMDLTSIQPHMYLVARWAVLFLTHGALVWDKGWGCQGVSCQISSSLSSSLLAHSPRFQTLLCPQVPKG